MHSVRINRIVSNLVTLPCTTTLLSLSFVGVSCRFFIQNSNVIIFSNSASFCCDKEVYEDPLQYQQFHQQVDCRR